VRGKQRVLVFKSNEWRESTQLEVSIPGDNASSGILCLGGRNSGAPYSAGDKRAVESLAQAIAPALAWGNAHVWRLSAGSVVPGQLGGVAVRGRRRPVGGGR